MRCSWRHSSGNVLIITVLSTNQHHDVIVMWQITLELQEIYSSGDWLNKCIGAISKDGAFQSMYYLHIISADIVRAVRIHIQMHGLSLLFCRAVLKVLKVALLNSMCLSYLLGHTQTHTRSVYQAQSLIFRMLFFFSPLVTECIRPFHSAWSSIIFNHPASECRSLPKTLYLHSDVIGLCGGVQYWWSALHTEWRRCDVTVGIVSSPHWASVDSVAVCAYAAVSQLCALKQVLFPTVVYSDTPEALRNGDEFKQECNSDLQPVQDCFALTGNQTRPGL